MSKRKSIMMPRVMLFLLMLSTIIKQKDRAFAVPILVHEDKDEARQNPLQYTMSEFMPSSMQR